MNWYMMFVWCGAVFGDVWSTVNSNHSEHLILNIPLSLVGINMDKRLQCASVRCSPAIAAVRHVAEQIDSKGPAFRTFFSIDPGATDHCTHLRYLRCSSHVIHLGMGLLWNVSWCSMMFIYNLIDLLEFKYILMGKIWENAFHSAVSCFFSA